MQGCTLSTIIPISLVYVLFGLTILISSIYLHVHAF